MERSYPYEAMESECRYKINNKAASDLGSVHLHRGDEHALKTAIATQVPSQLQLIAWEKKKIRNQINLK